MVDDTDGSTSSGPPPSGPPSGPLSGPPPERPPRRRRQSLLLALIGGIVLVVGVVGVLMGAGAFDGGGRGTGESAGAATLPPPAPRTAGGTTPPASTDPSSADGLHAFGDTQRYGDGVEVGVGTPVPFAPSRGAAGHEAGNTAVTIQVTVRNGTDARLDLALVTVTARDGDGREVTRVFDDEHHVGVGLTGSVLPGRSAVAVYGFDVPPSGTAALEVEVKVGFDRPSAFWIGRVPTP